MNRYKQRDRLVKGGEAPELLELLPPPDVASGSTAVAGGTALELLGLIGSKLVPLVS